MFRKTPQKQTSFVSPKGKEKQIDFFLTKRRYLKNVKDADYFLDQHAREGHACQEENKKHETIGYVEHKQKEKTSISKCPSSKKDAKKSWT